MLKKILLEGSKESALIAINLMTDAVQSTLGPSGKTVLIHRVDEDPFTTKDGVTVALEINHPDPIVNAIIQLFKKVASKMNDDVGDGTTSVTVLCREFIRRYFELDDIDKNDFRFKEIINRELEKTIDYIKSISTKIDIENIGQIATISANNDKIIGELFQEAYNGCGVDGHINIMESVTGKSYVNTIKGFVLGLGYAEKKYSNNPKTGFFEAKEAYVLILDSELSTKKEALEIINKADGMAIKKPLIIFAKEFSKEALRVIDYNNIDRVGLEICLIKNQFRNEEYQDILKDISAYSNTDPIVEFDRFEAEFGTVSNVIVKQGHTVFGGISETREEIFNQHIDELKQLLENEESEARKTALRKRISEMTNGVVTMYIGGDSDVEIKEKRDRVDDAYFACKAALQDGIVVGGGQALLCAAKEIGKPMTFSRGHDVDPQEEKFKKIFYDSIRRPFQQILKNSEHDDSDIIYKEKEVTLENGYNAKTREHENLLETGVIDPTKVVISALRNSVSIALTTISTECIIVDSHS